ncbi:MAG: FAD-binding oxidoreductase [Steroidobacteraceae bacterium]|nr:FAD-binding oxidoreductase [Steroidobacteraceae bacterium]
MAQVLPPNVSPERFSKALDEFAAIIGKEWVLTSEEDRNTYLDPFAPGNADEHASAGAIAPQSTEEVQAVVRVANKYRIPLWPVSTGRNLAYGSAAPVLRGTMVLDLKRMKRILEINEELGYALVEPGVSFFDLHDALRERGDTYWISSPAPGWGSVIGNALEHGVGYTPYGVHADTICGMEVVLPDGDVVRTGMGGVQGSREWQIFKLGYGPIWDGAFTQSNFGIVTKMGVWLMPAPGAVANVVVSLQDENALAPLVDTLRPLRLNDTINATYTIVNPYRAIIDDARLQGQVRADIYSGPGVLPKDVIARELAKRGKSPWSVNFNVFDVREAGLDLRLEAIRSAFGKLPRVNIDVQRWRAGEPRPGWARVDPGLFALGIVDWYGGPGGHMNFAPVCAPIGSRVVELYELIHRRFVEHGLDCYLGMLNSGNRGLILNAVMFFNRNDDDLTRRGRELYARLAAETAALGYGDYRAHISFMDHAAAMYTFNDHALRRLNERVKDALDPNGILAPGKQGIWPAGLRSFRKTGDHS